MDACLSTVGPQLEMVTTAVIQLVGAITDESDAESTIN